MNSDETSSRPRRRLWPWWTALLSGLLLAFSFPPFDLSGFAFLALVPLLCSVWLYQPVKRAGLFRFFTGYLAGVVFFTITFWWIGELAPLYATPGLRFLPFLLSLYLALFPAVWAWFAGWIVGGHFEVQPPDPLEPFARPPLLSSLRNLGIAVVLAAAWASLDWLRGWLLTGFGWNALGVALYKELALIQIAEFTGVPGLSFLLVLCNVIALVTVLRLRAEIGRVRLRPHFDFALTMAIVVLVFIYGVRTLARGTSKDAPILRVTSIQPNISQELKFTPGEDAQNQIWEALAQHHLVAAYGQPHLVLWPEACVPGGMFGSKDNLAFVQEMAGMVPALMLGTDDLSRDFPGDDHNSAALLIRGEPKPQLYDKIHLVPFGEYVPLRPLFTWLPEEILNGDFVPGTESKVFHLPDPGVKLAPLVCFEDTDADLTRRPVQMGAQVLVNLTNDGWFGTSCEPKTHLYNSVFRAVENRRPLVRSTNTGMTAQVDPLGRIELWAKPFVSETNSLPWEVRYAAAPELTFYTRHGDVFAKVCSALAIAAWVLRWWKMRRGQPAPPTPPRKNPRPDRIILQGPPDETPAS